MSPAEVFAEIIETNLPNLGIRVFVNHSPDESASCVLVYDTPSNRLEGRNMRSGQTDEHPTIYLMARGQDSSIFQKIEEISAMTDSVYRQTASDGQKLIVITKSNTIRFVGQEPQTRRYVYAQHYRMTLE